MKIEGETIPGSNISDLVSDAMRSRKNFNPTGSKEFFQALSKMNVPKDLVRNQERWKQLVGETSTARATPRSPPRSSSRFHTILKSYEERTHRNAGLIINHVIVYSINVLKCSLLSCFLGAKSRRAHILVFTIDLLN